MDSGKKVINAQNLLDPAFAELYRILASFKVVGNLAGAHPMSKQRDQLLSNAAFSAKRLRWDLCRRRAASF